MADPVVFERVEPGVARNDTAQWEAWDTNGDYWHIRYRWGELLVDRAPNKPAWQTGDFRQFEVDRWVVYKYGAPLWITTLDMLAHLRRQGVLADG